MKINNPKIFTEKQKNYCPYCIYNYKYIPMVYDFSKEVWKCNVCNEIVGKFEPMVQKGKLVAGNTQDFSKPYGRSVDFNKKIIPKVAETYNNPLDAWQNDEM